MTVLLLSCIYPRGLFHTMMTCDQVLFGVNIRTIIAGMQKRRRRNSHMDLFRSCITQELYNTSAGRTSDNGIVYQYDPFSIYYFPGGVLRRLLSWEISDQNPGRSL